MEDDVENSRKDVLLDLFLKLEETERLEMRRLRKDKTTVKYDRMFKGVAIVTGLGTNTIRLERENGKKLKAFEITSEIAKLIRKGDHLMMISGLRQGVWRLIQMDCMGSEIQHNGKPLLHLSFTRRSVDPLMSN